MPVHPVWIPFPCRKTPWQASRKRIDRSSRGFVSSLPSPFPRRFYKYRVRLGKVSRILGKRFDRVTKDELRVYVEEINESIEFTDSTKVDYRGTLKKFVRWLHEKNDKEFADWIREEMRRPLLEWTIS
jgi:hypothetical protein